MSTADDTSAADARAATRVRDRSASARIVVVGGGCYGSYYVRQLGAGAARRRGRVGRARRRRSRSRAVPSRRCTPDERPPRTAARRWRSGSDYFDALPRRRPRAHPDAHVDDAIVPSPLMPHLMARVARGTRAASAGPIAPCRTEPLGAAPDGALAARRRRRHALRELRRVDVPDQLHRAGAVPAHARRAELEHCPTGAARIRGRRARARAVRWRPFVFHCTHRTYGVGMIDVRDVVAADAAIAQRRHAGVARASSSARCRTVTARCSRLVARLSA